jgi:sialic acid synthase SpsE
MIDIVAEIGINHNGDIPLAGRMIEMAKQAGADVAKFQIYNPERILDKNSPVLAPWWNVILQTELNQRDVGYLKEKCDRVGIEFLASVFHPDKIHWTEDVGMKRYKIASLSIYDAELAKAIVKTGKPVIISYGMVENGRTPAITLAKQVDTKLIELYCVSEYPTPIEHVKFNGCFGDNGWYDGFSDHTIGITASVLAMSLGAKMIEKHVTTDRNSPGPDHSSSITFDELTQLCRMRDELEIMLYD